MQSKRRDNIEKGELSGQEHRNENIRDKSYNAITRGSINILRCPSKISIKEVMSKQVNIDKTNKTSEHSEISDNKEIVD